jgi:hypothetical protein
MGFWGKNKWFVLVLVVALAVLGVVALMLFRKPSQTGQPNLELSIVAPKAVDIGTETVMQFILANKETKTISKPKVEVMFPSGATFVESQPKPTNLTGTVYELADISPGANVVLWLKIKLDGNVGETKTITAKTLFSLAGLTAEFTTTKSADLTLTSSGMSVSVTGPNSAANGQPVSYSVRYDNQTDKDYDKARITMTLPSSFQMAEASPKPSFSSNTWDILDLKAGTSGEIRLSGSYTATGGEFLKVKAELSIPDASGNYFKQSENEFTTTIGSQPLQVSQTVVTEQQDGVALPGDMLTYNIKYQNTSADAARAVRVIFSFNSPTVDMATVQAEGGKVSGNEVTWTAGGKSSLEVLSPNDAGVLSLSIKVKNPPVNDRTLNPEVKTSVKIISNEYQDFQKGNDLLVKIASTPAISTSLAGSGGALPPRVGVRSSFQVSLMLQNTTSDILDSDVVAFLPTGVTFEASSLAGIEAGKVSYDVNTGKLTWKVGVLRAYSGAFAPKRQLDFQVSVIPSSSQTGMVLNLLRDIKFTGLENFTQRDISLKTDDVTTLDLGNEGRVGR